MKLSMFTLTLTTLFSLGLATTAPVVKAQSKTFSYPSSNPPAEVPSPSLIRLDPTSALNSPQMEQITAPLTKSLSLNQPTVITPVTKSSPNMQILDPKNTPATVPSPSLQSYQH